VSSQHEVIPKSHSKRDIVVDVAVMDVHHCSGSDHDDTLRASQVSSWKHSLQTKRILFMSTLALRFIYVRQYLLS